MQQTPGPEKRRSIMVDRPWQSSVATRLIVSSMVVVALTQIVMIFFLASGGEEPAQEPSDQWYLVVMLTSALQLVLLVATMWWATIRITHSVAGPAMLIERALDAMREGKFDSRLTLRDNDALKSLAEAAQRLADHLQQQQGTAPQARVTTGAAPHPVETR